MAVGGDTVERTRIGDSVVRVRTTPAGMMATPSSVFEYMHRYHLGSVEAQAGSTTRTMTMTTTETVRLVLDACSNWRLTSVYDWPLESFQPGRRKSRHALSGFSLARRRRVRDTWDMVRFPINSLTPMSAAVRPGPHGRVDRGGRRFRAVLGAAGRLAWLAWLAVAVFAAGCAAPSITVGSPTLAARPNPSLDGSYSVRWTPIAGASAYRLLEDGALSYEGPSLSRVYVGKAAGGYTYSLTYCISVLGVQVCDLRTGIRDVTVTVLSE